MKPDTNSHFQLCHDFESAVTDVLSNCSPDTAFLAAISGGADSMAMLAALNQIFSFNHEFAERQFSVLHVEHGIRPSQESCGDAEFVHAFCIKQGIKCSIKHIPQGKVAAFAQRKGIGVEAAARHFRHKALAAEAARLGEKVKILIAHTKDDMLETALMRVLRGSGPAGLAAMQSNLRFGANSREQRIEIDGICRPLLFITRAEVLAYLKAKGLPWREDATNADDVFLRNRIRNRLVPLLDEAFPSWRAGVSAMAETQSLVKDFIAEEARQRIKWVSQEISRRDLPDHLKLARAVVRREAQRTQRGINDFNGIYLLSTNTDNFFAQPLIVREEAVFLAIDELLKNKKNLRTVKRAVLRRFCQGSITAADLGKVRVKCDGGEIAVSLAKKEYFESGISRLV